MFVHWHFAIQLEVGSILFYHMPALFIVVSPWGFGAIFWAIPLNFRYIDCTQAFKAHENRPIRLTFIRTVCHWIFFPAVKIETAILIFDSSFWLYYATITCSQRFLSQTKIHLYWCIFLCVDSCMHVTIRFIEREMISLVRWKEMRR